MTDGPESAGGDAAATFEASMERLERIVRELEKGDLGLEKSLALFEEGVGLARRLESRLGEAEMTVEKLLRDSDGRESVEPLDLPEDDAP